MLRYLARLLVSVDQTLNTVLGGHEDETISSRLGRHKLANGGVVPWRTWFGLARLLDGLLEVVDDDHSVEAIEPWTCSNPDCQICSCRR